jgi:hypothetical protein
VGRFAWDDLEVNEYITFTLSSASYSWIEAGNAEGAFLSDLDFEDAEPPADMYESVWFYGANADTALAPRLKVTYTE